MSSKEIKQVADSSSVSTMSSNITIQQNNKISSNEINTGSDYIYQHIKDIAKLQTEVKEIQKREKDYFHQSSVSHFWKGVNIGLGCLVIVISVIGYFGYQKIQDIDNDIMKNRENIEKLMISREYTEISNRVAILETKLTPPTPSTTTPQK